MSRTPASYSMTVVRGSTWEDSFVYLQDDGVTPVDLTGYQARMQIRSLAGQFGTSTADTLVMELTTDNGRLTITPAEGKVALKVSATDTVLLNPDNAKKVKHVYALELFRPAGAGPEYVIPLVQGKITVQGEVVR